MTNTFCTPGCIDEKLRCEKKEPIKWPIEIFGEPKWYLKDISSRENLIKLIAKEIKLFVPPIKSNNDIVIDFGSGEGVSGIALSKKFDGRTICVDIDAHHLQWGIGLWRQNFKPAEAPVCFIESTFKNLPWISFKSYPKPIFTPKTESIRLFFSYLGCCANQIPAIIHELKSAMKPNASAIFIIPDFWINQESFDIRNGDKTTGFVIPPDKFKKCLSEIGWEVEIKNNFWRHEENDTRFNLKYWGNLISGLTKEQIRDEKYFHNSLGIIILRKN